MSSAHLYTPTNCIALAVGNYIVNDTVDGNRSIATGWIGNTCGYPVNADLLVRYTNTSTGEFTANVVRFTNGTDWFRNNIS